VRILKTYFLVLARDRQFIEKKIGELDQLRLSYLIVCGERVNHPNVMYREQRGKYDAINYGFRFIPEDVDIVALNDVDTHIGNLKPALKMFDSDKVALVFAKVYAKEGPQNLFLSIFRSLRAKLPLAASGDLMLIRREALKRALPIKPCKAEDSYLLFKILEAGYKIGDCEECYVEGEKTKKANEEEGYKRRTVAGIYQALAHTNPPYQVKLFYLLLPFVSPVLLILGKRGFFWMKGILLGLTDYLRGDRAGIW